MNRTTSKEKTIILTKEIVKGIEKLNLPYSTLNEALNLTHELLEKKVIKKISPKIFAASVIYTACKEEGHPVLLKEVCSIIGLNKSEAKRAMALYSYTIQKIKHFKKPNIFRYVERLINALELNDKVKDKAFIIVDEAKNKGLISGRNPISVAAAAIYIAAKKARINVTQKEISAKAYITEVTLRNRYKELLSILKEKIREKIQVKKIAK